MRAKKKKITHVVVCLLESCPHHNHLIIYGTLLCHISSPVFWISLEVWSGCERVALILPGLVPWVFPPRLSLTSDHMEEIPWPCGASKPSTHSKQYVTHKTLSHPREGNVCEVGGGGRCWPTVESSTAPLTYTKSSSSLTSVLDKP